MNGPELRSDFNLNSFWRYRNSEINYGLYKLNRVLFCITKLNSDSKSLRVYESHSMTIRIGLKNSIGDTFIHGIIVGYSWFQIERIHWFGWQITLGNWCWCWCPKRLKYNFNKLIGSLLFTLSIPSLAKAQWSQAAWAPRQKAGRRKLSDSRHWE